MKTTLRGMGVGLIALAALGQLGGCPVGVPPLEYVAGGGGESALITSQASVTVQTPAGDLSIIGGTQVEVNWQAYATSVYATLHVIVDEDRTPDNGNETRAYSDLALTTRKALVDTTRLRQGTYNIGVLVEQFGETVAYGYATGRIIIDQRPDLYFLTPRDNLIYDRTAKINPTINVAWELDDPDSTNAVNVYLDPDESPNGNEILLYTSESQTGDRFAFELPTSLFAAGTYRLLALVTDGRNATPFYMPGSIHLRARLAGPVDLRDMHLPETGISGAVFEGFNPRDNLGSFLSSAQDIDGDGFDDLMLVSQFGKPDYNLNLARTGIGEAYLIYGRANRFTGVTSVNSTGVLFRGDVYTGAPEAANPIRPSRGITSFGVLSDWDADGIREFAFGIPFCDSIRDTTRFTLEQQGYFRSGAVVVVAVGSVQPGFPGGDVIRLHRIGTFTIAQDGEDQECPMGFEGPKAPSVPSGTTGFYKYYDATVPTGMLGCRISTVEFGDQCGESIAPYPFYGGFTDPLANPDGSLDVGGIVISVPGRDPAYASRSPSLPGAGMVSVYYPARGFNPWNVDDDYLPHRGPFHYVLDDAVWDVGYYVDPDNSEPCERWTRQELPHPERTARFYGGFAGAAVGNADLATDINADGFNDLLIGSPYSNEGTGASFIVLGRLPPLVMGAELSLEELGLPMNVSNPPVGERRFDGIRIIGSPGDRLGQAQARGGDFNGDGLGDTIIGSPFVANRKGGAAVFFGSREIINLTQREIPFDEIPTRGLGVIFMGEKDGDLAGARVATAGDVDGDGLDDLLIAAPNRSVRLDGNLDGRYEIDRTHCGVVYLIYGSASLRGTLSLADIGTEALPGVVFIGRRTGDYLGAGLGEHGDRAKGIASAGDVDGDGFGDLLIGSVSASPRDRARAGEIYLLYGTGD